MSEKRWAPIVLGVALATAVGIGQQREPHSRLFPPSQLGLLEGPDRDEWQQPERVMDDLQIFTGARVADVGAGGGWFTIRLAERVGQNGVVYAEDIQPQMIELIERRVAREGWKNVQT
jgi:2-polyprenyl-3-methyl-5-hydroxy-6-metoxy-1,4-benzoquinol methylase